MPIDYSKYAPNWKDEIRPAILKRERFKCKFCGVLHKSSGYRETDKRFIECDEFMLNWAKVHQKKIIRIILTVAHLDHDITNNDYKNLAALCQQCHNRYDAANRAVTRAITRAKRSN